MFDEPALLLERTIHNLEVLADLLGAEAAERRGMPSTAVTCLAAENAIQTMLPKLQAAGDVWREQIGLPRMRQGCVNCED